MHTGEETPRSSAQDGTAALKREIRAGVRQRRRAMTARDRAAASALLTDRLVGLVRSAGAQRIACYAALPDEPDTAGLLARCLAADIEVLLPVSLPGGALEWRRHNGKPLAEGRHGIPEPTGPSLPASAAADLDLLLIPACAVDERGGRLGWGMGYYDRLLASLDAEGHRPPVYALVFDHDVVPRIPSEPHDAPIDGAVTPSRTLRFA